MNDLQGSFVADLHDPPNLDLSTLINTLVLFTDPIWDKAQLTDSHGGNIEQVESLDDLGLALIFP